MKEYSFDWYDGFDAAYEDDLSAGYKANCEQNDMPETGDEEQPFIAQILGKPLEHAVQEYRKALMRFQDWGGPRQQEFFQSYDLDNELGILLGYCTPRIAKLLLDCLAFKMRICLEDHPENAYPVFLADCQAVRFRHFRYEPLWNKNAKFITTDTLVRDKNAFEIFYSYALMTINALDDEDRACLLKHFSDFAEAGNIMTEGDFDEAKDAFESSHRPLPDTLNDDAAAFYQSLDPKLDTMTRLMMKEAFVYESYNHQEDWKTAGEEEDEKFTRFAKECDLMPWELLPLKDEYRSRPVEEWDMKPIFPVIDYDPEPEPWQEGRFLNYGFRDIDLLCEESEGFNYPEDDNAYTERLRKAMIAGRVSWYLNQYEVYEQEQLKRWEDFKKEAVCDQEFVRKFSAAVLEHHGDLSCIGNEEHAFDLFLMSQERFLRDLRDFICHNADYYEYDGDEIFEEFCSSTDVSEIADWNHRVFRHFLKDWDKTAIFL